eukprot:Selendium_serpulae@DN6168_c0_g1_i1.p1
MQYTKRLIFVAASLLVVTANGQDDLITSGLLKIGELSEEGIIVPPADVDLTEDENPNGANYVDSLRAQYPDCPMGCETDWPGDGWCDNECAGDDCGNDAGDCEDWCAPDCKPDWLGDGFCDRDCNRNECKYDDGDCTGNNDNVPGQDVETFDYSRCKCDHDLLENKECDETCNTKECNWDGLDCNHQCNPECAFMWLGDGDCDDACNVADCDFDKGDCAECAPGCVQWQVGNGLCDKGCQNKECNHDQGDCDGICKVYDFSYDDAVFHYPHCRDEWIGDGHCDCLCKTEECELDGGDCARIDCSVILSDLRLALLEVLKADEYQTEPDEGIKAKPIEGATSIDESTIREQRIAQKPPQDRRQLQSEKKLTQAIEQLSTVERRRLLGSLLPSERDAKSLPTSVEYRKRRRRKLNANTRLFDSNKDFAPAEKRELSEL